MTVQPRKIKIYITATGRIPFREWFDSLRDRQAQLRIRSRLARVKVGNLGDSKSVGQGVFELRIDYGPGYRIYFGQDGLTLVVLLCAGDKSTQQQDIYQAQLYWRDYGNSQSTEDY
ncbi:type II toxin-antitoxin system RelE/ParE family toxin [Pannus brasiliensis CCIBt3594]|uniref:Type II toxin-antitoxin system RelE/ParE family toxin n=1 Tax=Pannus brasiliensis CCIBt3594 TaxID=1427578 RepID=A0AAW9QM55_9CHRO